MSEIAKLNLILVNRPTAIKIDGEEGGEIALAFDDSELPEVMKLAAFGRNKVLTVTFES
jgi:hypothetical protein